MSKQWWEYLIDGFVIISTFFAGMSIWADNKREKEEQVRQDEFWDRHKEKLIHSLLAELKGIARFCRENEGDLSMVSPYSFETTIIQLQ